jgi:DNA-binding transcriptional MerR regulator
MPLLTKKNLPDMPAIARNWAKYKGTSLKSISRKLKKNPEFLRQNLSTRDARPSVLLALSDFLGENLFEYYLELLPPHVRPTAREKELQKQIDELQKELKRVGEERDKYWTTLSGQVRKF